MRDACMHVADGGRGELELMEADVEAAVGHHAVGMWPRVGGAAVAETQSFVEGDRSGYVRRFDADFVKLS
jgi:hypothetical protein